MKLFWLYLFLNIQYVQSYTGIIFKNSKRIWNDFQKCYASMRSNYMRRENIPKRPKKPSLIDGYSYGDVSSIKALFSQYSSSGRLSFKTLESSKYLRFWPGKLTQAKNIWESICGKDNEYCSLDQIIKFHELLDGFASEIYSEMENERIQWQEEKLISDMLEKFFYSYSVNNRLTFQQFIQWDVIKSEIWYNDLLPEYIQELWSKVSSRDNNTVGFKEFRKLYETICSDSLILYSSQDLPRP